MTAHSHTLTSVLKSMKAMHHGRKDHYDNAATTPQATTTAPARATPRPGRQTAVPFSSASCSSPS